MKRVEDLTHVLDDLITKRKSRKRKLLRRTLVISAVVAIIVLSAFSILVYRQSKDYYNAKYRSQNIIVTQISGYASWIGDSIHDAVNMSLSQSQRDVAGTKALEDLQAMSVLVTAVREMYLEDHEKCETFLVLHVALNSLWMWLGQYNLHLVDSIDMRTKLSSAGDALSGLTPVLNAGFRSDVDFEKHPYSVIGRVDLASIRSIAGSIIDLFSGPILLTP